MPPTQPLVLVVEGHDDTRALYAIALSAMGFDVVPARDGAEAYRRACEMHPDIVVTDLPMREYDGWQFLHDLKHDPRTRDIPLVAVTGYVERSVRERTERDGFAAFLPKPCPPDELADRLRQVLNANTMRRSGAEARGGRFRGVGRVRPHQSDETQNGMTNGSSGRRADPEVRALLERAEAAVQRNRHVIANVGTLARALADAVERGDEWLGKQRNADAPGANDTESSEHARLTGPTPGSLSPQPTNRR